MSAEKEIGSRRGLAKGLTGALQAASAKAAEDHQKTVRDRLIQYHHDVYGTASAYDNAVMIAGYVAFFALWSGVYSDIPHGAAGHRLAHGNIIDVLYQLATQSDAHSPNIRVRMCTHI